MCVCALPGQGGVLVGRQDGLGINYSPTSGLYGPGTMQYSEQILKTVAKV